MNKRRFCSIEKGIGLAVCVILGSLWVSCEGTSPTNDGSSSSSTSGSSGDSNAPEDKEKKDKGSTNGTSSEETPVASEWAVVVSSGSQALANSKFSGGVTNGEVAGAFDLFILPSNPDVGWSVGNLGEVFKTTDAGVSSTAVSSFPSSGIQRSVRAVSENEVWITGRDTVNDGASIFASTDGGATWTVQFNTATAYPNRSITSTDRINAIDFVTNKLGFAAGGLGDNTNLILKTTDGMTWTEVYRQATSGTDDELHSIYFVDGDIGYAVGNTSVILKTIDGGITWIDQTETSIPHNLYEVRCVDANKCYIAGDGGTVAKTTDGGRGWLLQLIFTTTDFSALDVVGDKIWVGGAEGKIYFSADGGAQWTQQTTNTTFMVQSIYMIMESIGWAACASTTSNTGALLSTVPSTQK